MHAAIIASIGLQALKAAARVMETVGTGVYRDWSEGRKRPWFPHAIPKLGESMGRAEHASELCGHGREGTDSRRKTPAVTQRCAHETGLCGRNGIIRVAATPKSLWVTFRPDLLEHVMGKKATSSHPLAIAALIAVNLIPLHGVAQRGWGVDLLLLLYWAETAIVGAYCMLKLAAMKGRGAFYEVPFFCFQLGIFMGVHAFFLKLIGQWNEPEPTSFYVPHVDSLSDYIVHTLGQIEPSWVLPLGALFISHGMSFLLNFSRYADRLVDSDYDPMAAVYTRVFVMQFAIILGNFVFLASGSNLGVLIILIVGKIVVDLGLHIDEHKTALQPEAKPIRKRRGPGPWKSRASRRIRMQRLAKAESRAKQVRAVIELKE